MNAAAAVKALIRSRSSCLCLSHSKIGHTGYGRDHPFTCGDIRANLSALKAQKGFPLHEPYIGV